MLEDNKLAACESHAHLVQENLFSLVISVLVLRSRLKSSLTNYCLLFVHTHTNWYIR